MKFGSGEKVSFLSDLALMKHNVKTLAFEDTNKVPWQVAQVKPQKKGATLHPFLDRPDSLIIALFCLSLACVPSHSLCPQPLSRGVIIIKGLFTNTYNFIGYTEFSTRHFTILSSSTKGLWGTGGRREPWIPPLSFCRKLCQGFPEPILISKATPCPRFHSSVCVQDSDLPVRITRHSCL